MTKRFPIIITTQGSEETVILNVELDIDFDEVSLQPNLFSLIKNGKPIISINTNLAKSVKFGYDQDTAQSRSEQILELLRKIKDTKQKNIYEPLVDELNQLIASCDITINTDDIIPTISSTIKLSTKKPIEVKTWKVYTSVTKTTPIPSTVPTPAKSFTPTPSPFASTVKSFTPIPSTVTTPAKSFTPTPSTVPATAKISPPSIAISKPPVSKSSSAFVDNSKPTKKEDEEEEDDEEDEDEEEEEGKKYPIVISPFKTIKKKIKGISLFDGYKLNKEEYLKFKTSIEKNYYLKNPPNIGNLDLFTAISVTGKKPPDAIFEVLVKNLGITKY